jgi:hypothetical protein
MHPQMQTKALGNARVLFDLSILTGTNASDTESMG